MSSTLKIYGPPGTGKTRTLLDLLAKELETLNPGRVAFMTFTRAAKREALERVALMTKTEELIYLKTIHGLCYQALKVQGDQLIRPKDLRAFGQRLGLRITGSDRDPWALDDIHYLPEGPSVGDQILQLYHLARHHQVPIDEVMREAPPELELRMARWLVEAYDAWKRQESLIDYTDLLEDYLRVGKPLPVTAVFVDEAQDLSRLQWLVVHRLSLRAERVYLAGDDDQAIFGWAGASAHLFNEEPATEVQTLLQSYRLTEEVWQLASGIIERVRQRVAKRVRPRGPGDKVTPVGYLSADLVNADSNLVLFRNNHRGAALARQLMELGVPFAGGGSPLSLNAQACLRAWHKLISLEVPVSPTEAWLLVNASGAEWLEVGAVQAARRPKGVVVRQEIFLRPPRFEEWPRALYRLPALPYLERAARLHGFHSLLEPRTRLLSIHQAKGHEADHVVLDLELARRTYDAWLREPDDEHRVWYVAVTRTKTRLFTLLPASGSAYHL